MTELPIHAATRNDLAGNPQLSGGPPAAQLQRFLALEDILIGFGEGIDGARLEAGLTWAKHGDAQANRDALVRLFASRWIAAQEEGEWEGDATAEGARDLDELTAVAAALATCEFTQPEWIGVDAATDAPQEFRDWAARFSASRRAPNELRAAAKALSGATYQKSETITLTASGDETCAELKQHMASVLPQEFKFAGGLDRIRKGDPVLGTNRLHDRDQQAHAAFVAHHPRQALATLSEGQ